MRTYRRLRTFEVEEIKEILKGICVSENPGMEKDRDRLIAEIPLFLYDDQEDELQVEILIETTGEKEGKERE